MERELIIKIFSVLMLAIACMPVEEKGKLLFKEEVENTSKAKALSNSIDFKKRERLKRKKGSVKQEVIRYFKCHFLITRERPRLDDSAKFRFNDKVFSFGDIPKLIKAQKSPEAAKSVSTNACYELLKRADLDGDKSSATVDSEDELAQKIFENFYDLHRSWFKNTNANNLGADADYFESIEGAIRNNMALFLDEFSHKDVIRGEEYFAGNRFIPDDYQGEAYTFSSDHPYFSQANYVARLEQPADSGIVRLQAIGREYLYQRLNTEVPVLKFHEVADLLVDYPYFEKADNMALSIKGNIKGAKPPVYPTEKSKTYDWISLPLMDNPINFTFGTYRSDAIFKLREKDKWSETDPGDCVPEPINRGKLIGSYLVTPTVPCVMKTLMPTDDRYGRDYSIDNKTSFDFYKHMGGGVIGSKNYIRLNHDSGGNGTKNQILNESFSRNFARQIFNDFICRDIPLLRAENIPNEFWPWQGDGDPYPDHSFHGSESCMQCHSTIDSVSGIFRNIFVKQTVRKSLMKFRDNIKRGGWKRTYTIPFCDGGSNHGKSCDMNDSSASCPEGTCSEWNKVHTPPFCQGGANDGQPCDINNGTEDCPNGTCTYGTDYSLGKIKSEEEIKVILTGNVPAVSGIKTGYTNGSWKIEYFKEPLLMSVYNRSDGIISVIETFYEPLDFNPEQFMWRHGGKPQLLDPKVMFENSPLDFGIDYPIWPSENYHANRKFNFSRSIPKGELHFDDIAGNKITNTDLIGVESLGRELSSTLDYSACYAKRYFKFLTGEDILLFSDYQKDGDSINNPNRYLKQMTCTNLKKFEFIKNLGRKLRLGIDGNSNSEENEIYDLKMVLMDIITHDYFLESVTGVVEVDESQCDRGEENVDEVLDSKIFTNTIRPLLRGNCKDCHDSNISSATWREQDFIKEEYVIPQNPCASKIYFTLKNNGCPDDGQYKFGTMPIGPTLTTEETLAIKEWIEKMP